LLTTGKEKEENLIENHTPFPMVKGVHPYRNFKSENSQDFAQNPQQNCMFMNSASALLRNIDSK
jgi:hypothetical protein